MCNLMLFSKISTQFGCALEPRFASNSATLVECHFFHSNIQNRGRAPKIAPGIRFAAHRFWASQRACVVGRVLLRMPTTATGSHSSSSIRKLKPRAVNRNLIYCAVQKYDICNHLAAVLPLCSVGGSYFCSATLPV